ncbi:MAG TPA: prohibitin family protein [Nitrososphaeraceae archaeon]|nr:prohibitin family protein [Nitrososphaeraceae archaeon]
MRNPFKRSGKSYDRRTPEGEPLEYVGSRSFMGLNKLKILAAIITFIIIIVILSESVVIVQAGHRGVVLYVGAVENRVLGEGLHFIIPFAEQVIQLEVRTLKFQADASAASNDLQEVATVIALNYHIDPNDANIVYQQLGADYADRIIAPTIQESVKASVAKFNAEELITKRETAKAVIAQAIRNTLSTRDITVETVFITDFKFSEAFANQVESKVVAYQKYLTEQNNLRAVQVVANQTVVQAQAQARSNVARAEGEAQAIKVITDQLRQDPQYLQWQSINKWNGQMPYALGSGGFPFFQLPLQPQQQQQQQQLSSQNQTNR